MAGKRDRTKWDVGVRLWLERSGHAVLGKGRLELLEGIDSWHSISAAARHMRMSYRRAWLLVQSINRAAGERLVEAGPGGTHGGGARLTERGRAALAIFRALQAGLQTSAAETLGSLLEECQAHGFLLDAVMTKGIQRAKSLKQAVSLEAVMLSARNQFKGKVKEVKLGNVAAEVVVSVGPLEFVSMITRGSAESLGLKVGDAVTVVVKATEVLIDK